MPFMIKIPKQSAASTSQMTATESSHRKSKRRQAAVYSDDDDDAENIAAANESARSIKRAKTDERSLGGASAGGVDADGGEEQVKVEEDEDVDTRFLPPMSKRARKGSSATASQKGKSKQAARKSTGKKRAVVLSDEDAEDEYDGDGDGDGGADEDDEFTPEPQSGRRGATSKSRGKGIRKGSNGPREEEIVMKDERKSIPPTALAPVGTQGAKRSHPPEDEEPVDIETVVKESTPPPFKKRKLPTIKKNKPALSTTSSTPSSGKSAVKPAPDEKDAFALPAPLRKPAATMGNADFDLRDASVYAQLFTKPGGTTPNSGLNRKEKEEERRRELSKMREEARAKRLAATKSPFDLQAAAEKIQRFEEKLQARKSLAVYPNILGAAFKETFEKVKRRERDRSGARTSH